jgi:hypothetical protein
LQVAKLQGRDLSILREKVLEPCKELVRVPATLPRIPFLQ